MGELHGSELANVEANLEKYPALRLELARIEEDIELIMFKGAVQPPIAVRAKLMESVAEKGKVVQMVAPVATNGWKYATAASIVIAAGALLTAYDFYARWKKSELALNELAAQNRQIAQDYNRVNLRLDQMETYLTVADNPAFTKVVMKGTANAPQALASVYWNEQTKEVFLSVQNLRALAKEKQYQLWAIVDGKPIDAGVFDASPTGLLKMKAVPPGATAFAVTIEPMGGKASPTLETMQVAGTTSKG